MTTSRRMASSGREGGTWPPVQRWRNQGPSVSMASTTVAAMMRANWQARRWSERTSGMLRAPKARDSSGSKVLFTIWTICRATRETVRAVPKTTTAVGPSAAPTAIRVPWRLRALPMGKPIKAMAGPEMRLISPQEAWRQPNSIQGTSRATMSDRITVTVRLAPAKTNATERIPPPRTTGMSMAEKAASEKRLLTSEPKG